MKYLFITLTILFITLTVNSQNYIYWSSTETNNIQRKRLSGDFVMEKLIDHQNTPRGISIDYEHGKLYFADGEHNSISVVNLDGSGLEYLNETNEPIDVYYDKRTGYLYYTDVTEGKISRFESNFTMDRTLASGLKEPRYFDIDIIKDNIYFASKQDEKSIIYRTSLLGSNLVEIVNVEGFITGLAVDSYNEKLYWLNRKTAKVHSSNLDGTNQEIIANTSPICAALELDDINGKLYWTEKDNKKIKVIDVNGSNFKTYLNDVGGIGGITFDLMHSCSKIIEVYDTNYITVTDTLLIDVTFTGLNNQNKINTIKIYPNPTNKFIFIELEENFSSISNYSMKIINTTGQKVFETVLNERIFKINIDDFKTNGLYFVQVINNNNEIIDIKKIILK